MFPRRFLFGAICTITAFAAIGISGHTTIPEAAAAETTVSSMLPCVCVSCDGDVVPYTAQTLNCDGEVDVLDLLKVLDDLGKTCGFEYFFLADADRDGDVDEDDLDTVLNNWGSCP